MHKWACPDCGSIGQQYSSKLISKEKLFDIPDPELKILYSYHLIQTELNRLK